MTERRITLEGVLWATRGRTWGFRFLLDGGLADPLPTYEQAVSPLGDQRSGRVGDNHRVAVRFPDPEGRRDRSGRLIPHDFVVSGDLSERITSVDDALDVLWPVVAAAYARVWQSERPPGAEDLRFGAPRDADEDH